MSYDIDDKSRTEWEHLINEYIFDEIDRAILCRRLLDGVTLERLAEEFDFSVTHIKNRFYKAKNKLFSKIGR